MSVNVFTRARFAIDTFSVRNRVENDAISKCSQGGKSYPGNHHLRTSFSEIPSYVAGFVIVHYQHKRCAVVL